MRAIFYLLTITLSAVTAASGCGNGCLGEKEKVSPSENPFEDQIGLDPIGEEYKDLPVAEQLKQIGTGPEVVPDLNRHFTVLARGHLVGPNGGVP